MKRAAISTLALFALLTAACWGEPKEMPTESGKPFIHKPSGFEFPAKVGDFERISAYQYDEDGSNISVGYKPESMLLTATTYVYPAAAETLDEHFKQIKQEILTYYRDAKVVSESPAIVRQGDAEYTYKRFVFTYKRGDQQAVELRSETYLLALGKRFIKFRFTYPADQLEKSDKAVTAFMEALTLPKARD